MLTAFVTSPPSSAAATCSATITPGAVLRLLGRGGEVRRDDDVVELEQRARVRLRRRRRRARRRRACPSAAPRPAPSSSTSSPRAALTSRTPSAHASRTRRASSEAARLRRQRQVQRHEVGRRRARSSARLDALDAELAEALRRDERVVRDDAHAEPERAARDLLADAAEAEHAERLAGELDAAPAPSAPSGPA